MDQKHKVQIRFNRLIDESSDEDQTDHFSQPAFLNLQDIDHVAPAEPQLELNN